jgi:glycosyltransferase involved in cell wall biosynthesis
VFILNVEFCKLELRTENPSKICIVTPTFNSARYLDATIVSVLSQAGDFVIDYHVQDGGSSDSTVSILESWKERLANQAFPQFCKKVNFTYSTEKDGGMYDAINKGFLGLSPGPSDLLTWLGSDDLLAPGAIATVLSVLSAYPEIALLGGRPTLIDADGIIQGLGSALAYARACMKNGLYDGRAQKFIMQEGSFWRGWLWHKVGGLDASFRLAGDWDLWRRFAEHADYYSVDTVTAFHRRREGQLSEQMDKYYAEIDARLEETGRADYENMRAAVDGQTQKTNEFSGMVLAFSAMQKQWLWEPHFSFTNRAPRVINAKKLHDGFPVQILEGAGTSEGPHPQYGLPAGVRWMHAPELKASVSVPRAGKYILVLCCRAVRANLRVRIRTAKAKVLDCVFNQECADIDRDVILREPVYLRKGTNILTVLVGPRDKIAEDITHRLLFVGWHVESSFRSSHLPKYSRFAGLLSHLKGRSKRAFAFRKFGSAPKKTGLSSS